MRLVLVDLLVRDYLVKLLRGRLGDFCFLRLDLRSEIVTL
jgi:hypothetical protein